MIAVNNFDRALWNNLKTLSVSINNSGKSGKVAFSIVIPKGYGNHLHITAGGAVATLHDGVTASTLALITKDGSWDGKEVTRNLEVRYYRRVPMEEELKIECEIVDAGQSVATISAELRRSSDGALLASCQHDKIYPSRARL